MVLLDALKEGRFFVAEVRLSSKPGLHGKSYIGEHCFLHTSANLSRNGLLRNLEDGTLSACLPTINGRRASLVTDDDVAKVKRDFDEVFAIGTRIETELEDAVERLLRVSDVVDVAVNVLEALRPKTTFRPDPLRPAKSVQLARAL